MAIYKVGVQFSIYGYLDIEANSKEEALKIAQDDDGIYITDDVYDQDYVIHSWKADIDNVKEVD